MSLSKEVVDNACNSLAKMWAHGRSNLARISQEGYSDPKKYNKVLQVENKVGSLARMTGRDPNKVEMQSISDARVSRN